jgi:hypothetical protein
MLDIQQKKPKHIQNMQVPTAAKMRVKSESPLRSLDKNPEKLDKP